MCGMLTVAAAIALSVDSASGVRSEQTALANRLGVKSLEAEMTLTIYTFAPNRVQTLSEKVWMSSGRTRVDAVSDNPGLGRAVNQRTVECSGCELATHYLTYKDVPNMIATLNRTDSNKNIYFSAKSDRRSVGYVPSPISSMHMMRLDQYVNSSNRRDVAYSDEMYDGVNCRVVRYRLPGEEPQFSIWYDISRGMHPRRILYEEGPVGNPSFRKELLTELQAVSPNHWYPKRTTFTLGNDKKLQYKEVVDVHKIAINSPIRDSVFSLSGIGLSENKVVTVEGDRGSSSDFVWRGGRLIPLSEARKEWEKNQPAPEPVSLAPAQSPRYWLYVLAGVFTLTAIVLARRAFRKTP